MSLIIGADGERPRAPVLPEADIDMPRPETAPAASPSLTDGQVRTMLHHEDPLVRQFAVEQVVHRRMNDLAPDLQNLVADEPMVSVPAVQGLEELRISSAADALVARIADARGELLSVVCSAIATLAPKRLVDALKARGRIDDEAFVGVMSAVAMVRTEAATAFIDRAVNRAHLQSAERQAAVYSAALMSGSAKPVRKVLNRALEDSLQPGEEQPGLVPSRVALAGVAGAPPLLALFEHAQDLWKAADETLRASAEDGLGPERMSVLLDALLKRRIADILEALRPLLDVAPADDPDTQNDLGTMPERRRDLLAQMLALRDRFADLQPEAAAVFAAAAARATAIVMLQRGEAVSSPGVLAVAKASDGRLSPELLVHASEEELAQTLSELSARALRPVVMAFARERFHRSGTLRRLARAMFAAGHGVPLLEAAAESSEAQVHGAVARAALDHFEAAEAATLEILSAHPLEASSASMAMLMSERLRSQRLTLVLGRRFYELRAINPTMLSQASLRSGDPRLLPLLESRAFADEPEETAWVVLARTANLPLEGKLKEATQRVQTDRPPTGPLHVPLKCGTCQETLSYGFAHAFVDVEAKDGLGDPAFVGDMICKACGAEDDLHPTESTIHILTQHMMQLLTELQQGQVTSPPLVTPGQTEVDGQKVGLAEAFRRLTQAVESTPDGIRSRLHRARLGLMLHRRTVQTDLDQLEALDPSSVEARALRAQHLHARGESESAMKALAEVVGRLSEEPEPRLYESPDPQTLRFSLEELMVELADEGVAVPSGIDLGPAEQRRADREGARREAAHAHAHHSGAHGDHVH
ncbi:MAG: hypothetical protein ACFB9M_13440 [Myxococcota bacterium]